MTRSRLKPASVLAPFLFGLLFVLAEGCGAKQQFIEGRVLDTCDRNWPICDQVAGCLLGGQSYIEGRLPGTTRLSVQLAEPSTVRVHIFLDSVTAAGQETALSFYETGCINRTRQSVTGQAFVGESSQIGEFIREADLSAVGDHLISLTSDAEARFTLKLDIIAKRTQ